MIYEARQSRTIHFALAGAVLALSILGFAAAGVIPTGSEPNPAVGWAIVAACVAVAALFVMRGLDARVQARIDERGVYSRRNGPDPVPWNDISRLYVIRAGIQRIGRFERESGANFGINTTFYDRGIADLLAAVRHHRPDLVP